MKNDVGLKNIALELGISVNAVSRALRDMDDISESIKEKVREKAIEMNYVPLSMAKNLKLGSTKTIAVLVDSLKSPYFGMINELLIEELKTIGYRVLIIPTNSFIACKDNIKEALELRVDGIITFLIPNKDAYDIATLHKTPMLLFGRYFEFPKMSCLYMNDYMGGQIAGQYLIEEKQCKKLCYVGSSNIECNNRRRDGFFDYARSKGIEEYVYLEADKKYEKVIELIENGYNGFFCFDDLLANFVVKYQTNKKINVVGFNGESRFYEYAYNITSIESDYLLMVKEAVEILLDQILNGADRKIKKFDTKLYLGNT